MTTAIICSALLGILVFVLGFTISVTRGRTKVGSGYTTDPTSYLYKLVRAHGNTTEYVPMLAVLMLFLGSRDPSSWIIWTMIFTTTCRYLLVAGLLLGPTMDEPYPLRFIGAAGTYIGGVVLCIAMLLKV
jgi:uncharacterized membrane protein YecN with MAPEG domain